VRAVSRAARITIPRAFVGAREFREAAACFADCASAGLNHASLWRMAASCRELAANTPSDDWESVTRLESK